MEKITIKQIAKLAGVSTSAVSIVLNGRKGVSDDTRKKIKHIINEVNYTPNVNSRRLVLQRSFNIYLVLADQLVTLDNTFYTAILKSIVQKADELGYNLVLTISSDVMEGSTIFNAVKQQNLDGIIFLQDIGGERHLYLKKNQVPFVVIDSHKNSSDYPCIRGDYELSAYAAVNYLISQGHSNIGMIGMGKIPEFYLASFKGFKRALEEKALACSLDWIQSDAFDEQSGYQCMEKIIASSRLPSAVYCTGDIFAIGAMDCAKKHGLEVPNDISFCGLDNIILSRYCSPTLTTVEIDEEKMGILAVELLDKIINNQEISNISIIQSDHIIERQSVRNLNVPK